MLKSLKSALCRLLQARWAIAFWVDGRLMVVGNPYRDRWFADPFIVDGDEREVMILVQNRSLDTKNGRQRDFECFVDFFQSWLARYLKKVYICIVINLKKVFDPIFEYLKKVQRTLL